MISQFRTPAKGKTGPKRIPENSPLPLFDPLKHSSAVPLLPDGSNMVRYKHYPVTILKEFVIGKYGKSVRKVKVGSQHTVVRSFTNSVLLCKGRMLCFKTDAVVGVDFDYLPFETKTDMVSLKRNHDLDSEDEEDE